MPLKQPVSVVVEAFSRLPNKSEATLFNFLQEYFLPAGSDLAQVTPEDWKPFPAFLANISQPELRTWATFVHQRWQYLARVFVQNASCVGCYSSLPVARPFIIAGGRFREYYYWDSYWIIEGLLVSGMLNTTRNILLNMLDLVDQIGFMPNGGRIYYLDRSQPPLLTQMVAKYFEASHDMPLLVRALPTLDREYTWFMRQRAVTLPGGLVLNHYAANTTTPRPESWLNDVTTAQAVPESQRPQLFAEIATGAETGYVPPARTPHRWPCTRTHTHTSARIRTCAAFTDSRDVGGTFRPGGSRTE
jgi:alpha,alpha-trehalase